MRKCVQHRNKNSESESQQKREVDAKGNWARGRAWDCEEDDK